MRSLFVGVIACAAVAATAATPEYNYYRSVNWGPHPTVYRAVSATSDSAGGLYFTDNATDSVYYMGNIWTVSGATNDLDDTPRVANSTAGISFSDGLSFQGITFDGAYVYAGGQLNGDGDTSAYIRILPDNLEDPSSWTIERQDIAGDFGGPCAVGPNLLALTDRSSGELSIWEWSGTGLAQVSGPFSGSGLSGRMSAYDADAGKIYVATVDEGNSIAGRVDVFDYDSTTKVATYVGVFADGVSVSDVTASGVSYQQIAIDAEENVLAVGHTTGDASTAGIALFDTTETAPVAPYQLINFVPPLEAATGDGGKMGFAFGTQDGKKYFVGNDNSNQLYVYSQFPANVTDWAMY